MDSYIQRRNHISTELLNNIRSAFPDDFEVLSHAVDLCTILETSDPDQEFVDGIYGFMLYASDHDLDRRQAVSTIMHDLIEFKSNRHEAWFSPRTSSYTKYVSL
jgi:hypothetical protein